MEGMFFGVLIGIPASSASVRKDSNDDEHTCELGDPKNMKSSKICVILGTRKQCSRIQWMAELNASKILQLTERPNGRHLS